MADLNKIVDDLSSLTVLEAAELSKLLEEKWGVSAAAPVAVAATPGAAARCSMFACSTSLVARDWTQICLHRMLSSYNFSYMILCTDMEFCLQNRRQSATTLEHNRKKNKT